MPKLLTLALGTAFAFALSAPVMASTKSSTRVVECGAESCLLVTGRRDHAASAVSINGHAVPVQGAHRWRALVPVDTVRQWSDPFARTLTVAVEDSTTEAMLPIGLLGHVENLAMLVVRVK